MPKTRHIRPNVHLCPSCYILPVKNWPYTILLFALFLLPAAVASQTISDPYAALTPEQVTTLKPVLERYINDQLYGKWSDLFEIQEQTGRLKNELLLGNRSAPDMTREQFVEAMKETIGTGYPRLRSFKIQTVRADKDQFIVIGCGNATRESWRQTSIVKVRIQIIDGKPKFDLWEMTPDKCSDK